MTTPLRIQIYAWLADRLQERLNDELVEVGLDALDENHLLEYNAALIWDNTVELYYEGTERLGFNKQYRDEKYRFAIEAARTNTDLNELIRDIGRTEMALEQVLTRDTGLQAQFPNTVKRLELGSTEIVAAAADENPFLMVLNFPFSVEVRNTVPESRLPVW